MKITIITITAVVFFFSETISQNFTPLKFDNSLKKPVKSAFTSPYFTLNTVKNTFPVKNKNFNLSYIKKFPDVNSSRKLWQFEDMFSEYCMGGGIGAGLALAGGALGSLFHGVGDKSPSNSDDTYNIVVILMAIGHFVGVPVGTIITGEGLGVHGSIVGASLGAIIGDVGGIYLINKGKKWPGVISMLLITPLLSTLGFNIHMN